MLISTRITQALTEKNFSLAFKGFCELIIPFVETNADVSASLAKENRYSQLMG